MKDMFKVVGITMLVLFFMVVLGFVGFYTKKHIEYDLLYEDGTRDTIRQMVKTECLNKEQS